MQIPDTLAALTVPIAEISPYPGNPRRGDVALIVESLRAHGQYRPIVVQQATRQVLAGNHTLAAARSLGWTHIAATFIDCDDDTAARLVLIDNRANDVAGYDDAELAAMLAAMPDLEATGYSTADLDALLAAADPGPQPAEPVEEDEAPPLPADPITQPGDVWLLGPHRLVCGDCRDPLVIARLLDGARVNVAFTSPPYASQRTYDPTSGFVPIHPDAYVDWFAPVAANVAAHLAEDGSWFVNIKEHAQDGQRHLYVKDLTIAHVRAWGWMFVDELCWVDTRNGFPGSFPNRFKDAWEPVFHFAGSGAIKFRPLANGTASEDVVRYDPASHPHMDGDGYHVGGPRTFESGLARPSNVISIAAGGGTGGHSAAFPVALPAWFLRAYSDSGDVVLDPFAGSGSTLIAAERTGRVGYGVEISPGYCDVIAARFQTATGILPVLESSGEVVDFLTEAAVT